MAPDRNDAGLAKVASTADSMSNFFSEETAPMIRLRKFLPLVAVLLVGAGILGESNRAQAGYTVRVYDDGVLQGGITVFSVGNSLVFLGNTTHFSITNGSGLSNNPGTGPSSNLDLSSSEQIMTTFGASGGTHTIRIEISQTDWLAPNGSPLNLSSSAGGSMGYQQGSTIGATDTVTATYQGFLDNTNTLFGQPVAGSTAVQTASASLSSLGTAPLVFSPGTSVNNTVPGGTPFSMTDVLEFRFALAAGSGQTTANVSASTVASVPGPAGVVLVIAGLPVLGMGTWLRRRRQARLTTV